MALLTAGTLTGIPGARAHVGTEAQLAASPAGGCRHRLNRGGNRQLNAVLHRVAPAQARSHPRARAYLARRRQEG